MIKRARRSVLIRPTAEGWVFITILLFVTCGAILRSVNLLIFMAGMMSAPLLINWRIQRHMLKNLSASRGVPQHLHAGQLANIQWTCVNESRRISFWNLLIQDKVTPARLDEKSVVETQRTAPVMEPRNEQEPADAYRKRQEKFKRDKAAFKKSERSRQGAIAFPKLNIPEVGCQSEAFHSYRCLFAKRGRYSFGPATASTVFPFGLLSARRDIGAQQEIVVAPKLGKLSPVWDKRLDSIAVGSESANRRLGTSEEEFYAIRQWRSGDSQRHIHWRSTAKRNMPMVRQFDQQSDRDMGMVLDLYVPDMDQFNELQMSEQLRRADGEAELNDKNTFVKGIEPAHFQQRCELALSFAATVLASVGSTVKGNLSFGVFGATQRTLSDRNHHELAIRIMRVLALATPGSELDLSEHLFEFSRLVSQGTPIYVVSSRDQPEGLMENDRQRSILSPIRWINVSHPSFKDLFTPERVSEIEQLDELKEKWIADVAR